MSNTNDKPIFGTGGTKLPPGTSKPAGTQTTTGTSKPVDPTTATGTNKPAVPATGQSNEPDGDDDPNPLVNKGIGPRTPSKPGWPPTSFDGKDRPYTKPN